MAKPKDTNDNGTFTNYVGKQPTLTEKVKEVAAKTKDTLFEPH
jgi:hypothetical protein